MPHSSLERGWPYSSAMSSIADVDALLRPATVHTRASVLSRPSSVPAKPGLYAWYFDEAPPGVSVSDCHVTEHGALLYVGISPGRPPANGKAPSRQNLRTRIRYHCRGNAAGSTLRLTLGCHLAAKLGIVLTRVGSGDRLTFTPTGEALLSEWMAKHARVATLEHSAPWELEPAVINAVRVPLNIDHNSEHAYYPVNRALRAEHKAGARARSIWTP
ncbi:hypothetical protein GCM10025760_33330 [Microbacterium yannicii]|uniref:GIY-YIG catalytic domain-containing protein n=2 Tax=Microbacterium yannicii TaxID=671622 RepID=A0ABP9MPQ8_9MICO